MEPRTRIALIGLGNDFRHDDGVGLAVVDALRTRAAHRPLPRGTALSTCDGDPGRLIALWHEADLAVVVESAHAYPDQPGRVVRLEQDGRQLAGPSRTHSHGHVLAEGIELSRIFGRLPGRLVVYAVQGVDSSLGSGLSPTIAAEVARVAERIEDEVALHRCAVAHDRQPAMHAL
ncbi:hydrogenase maturation protease [Streptomyces sp. NPDC001970]